MILLFGNALFFFRMLTKFYFKIGFGKFWVKLAIFNEILTLYLFILTNFWCDVKNFRFLEFVLFETAYVWTDLSFKILFDLATLLLLQGRRHVRSVGEKKFWLLFSHLRTKICNIRRKKKIPVRNITGICVKA